MREGQHQEQTLAVDRNLRPNRRTNYKSYYKPSERSQEPGQDSIVNHH